MMVGGTHEIQPIEYRIVTKTIIYDETIVADDDWMGVFETESGSELRAVELRLNLENEPLHRPEKPGGRRVDVLGEIETPLFLISSSISVLTPGPLITSIYSHSLHLIRGTSIALNAPGLGETRLYTTDEGLFLCGSSIQQHITDTFPGGDGSAEFLGVVWAGDLDRDGKVDLLINDVGSGANRYNWNLYLSTEASPDQLVRKVASFYDVYY